MGRYGKGDQGEYEFTRAATDTIEDVERGCGVHVVCDIRPTPQRGVLALCMHAVDRKGTEGVTYIATYESSWPNSVATSFAAFYYQSAFKLARMVEAWYQARPEDNLPR